MVTLTILLSFNKAEMRRIPNDRRNTLEEGLILLFVAGTAMVLYSSFSLIRSPVVFCELGQMAVQMIQHSGFRLVTLPIHV